MRELTRSSQKCGARVANRRRSVPCPPGATARSEPGRLTMIDDDDDDDDSDNDDGHEDDEDDDGDDDDNDDNDSAHDAA